MSYGVTSEGFSTKPYDVILTSMIAKAREYYGEGIDLRPTASLYKFFQVVAYEISEQWTAAERYWSSIFIKTATGQSLDYKAEELGLERQIDTYASGTVTFTISSGTAPVTIPESSTVRTLNYIYYNTDEELIISSGTEGLITVTAQEVGSNGNVNDDEVIVIDPTIASVDSVTNDFAITGGYDAETDDELRSRVLNLPFTNWSSDRLETEINAISGIRKARITENYPSEYYFTCSVAPEVTGAMASGSEEYNQRLYDTVVDTLEETRPICSQYILTEVTPILVTIEADLTTSTLFNSTTGEANISSRISAYINSLNVDEDVLYSEIVWAIMEETGVTDVSNVLLNGVLATDITIASSEIAYLNTVIYNYV